MRGIVDAQSYRLASWKRASVAVNYRRFFDITDLIALRSHDPAVFRETHGLILRWIEDDVIGGLRIDHVDGLLDPQAYLDALREEVTRRRGVDGALPIVVEKILSTGERLREGWPVQGTTGYEFLNDLEAVFVDPDGAAEMAEGHRRIVGMRKRREFEEAILRGKELVLRSALTADVRHLRRLFRRALGPARAMELRGAAGAIRHFIAALPVYRTYLDNRSGVHPDDRAVIERAVDRARDRWGRRDELKRLAALLGAPRGEHAMRFVGRLQQTTGPATAKGVEDTALYRYVPLASLNEVGGDPARDFDHAVRDLHRANEQRLARWPRSLLCTSTHDTKRSADVRSRLDVLSEVSDEWLQSVQRWRRLLARHRIRAPRGVAPDAATEWLLFQSLLGVWPADAPAEAAATALRDRIVEYMCKANREAKVRTSWTSPHQGYERVVESYIEAALENQVFVTEMAGWAARVAPAGYCNGLSRLLVHLTAPGTPDIYQGDELWNFALVDPDNRRPVDFAARRDVLDRTDKAVARGDAATECADMLRSVADGRIKMHVMRTALRARREMPALFLHGTYQPVGTRGAKRRHAFAFMRGLGGETIVTAVTRLPVSLSGTRGIPTALAWGDSLIIFPARDVPRRWRCAFTGLTVQTQETVHGPALVARDVFLTLPVALLIAA
jgi:(1->4)-alpha-D-glucan 1-alpha-D-glucosylmutase